jgi:hypothetical protein
MNMEAIREGAALELAAPSTPQSRIEELDRSAITDPRRSANLATNRAVRFHVEKELSATEQAITATMTESIRQLTEAHQQTMSELDIALGRALGAISYRVDQLETRWWERLWRSLVFDIVAIRRWF